MRRVNVKVDSGERSVSRDSEVVILYTCQWIEVNYYSDRYKINAKFASATDFREIGPRHCWTATYHPTNPLLMDSIETLSEGFLSAFYEKSWSGEEVEMVTTLSIEEAYEVQDKVAAGRTARGEQVVGYKVGCTSAAIRQQFGLDEPIFGRLFVPHTRQCGEELDWKAFANCAIEPEMVIRTRSDLSGIDVSDEHLLEAIESVRPGIELHDFTFWHQPPATQELICSGGIHAGLLIGTDGVSGQQLNWQDERFSVLKDGVEVCSAPASEIMGGPLHSLRWLVEKLADRDDILPAGSLVIPGSPVELVAIDKDCMLEIQIEGVGSCQAQFRESSNSN